MYIVFCKIFLKPKMCFQLPCLYLGVVLSVWKLLILKEAAGQHLFWKLLYCLGAKLLRTNLKMHFRSLIGGKEHICHISSPFKHAGGNFFFLIFCLSCYSWPIKIEVASTHHVLEKAVAVLTIRLSLESMGGIWLTLGVSHFRKKL